MSADVLTMFFAHPWAGPLCWPMTAFHGLYVYLTPRLNSSSLNSYSILIIIIISSSSSSIITPAITNYYKSTCSFYINNTQRPSY